MRKKLCCKLRLAFFSLALPQGAWYIASLLKSTRFLIGNWCSG